jgi:hypothetical protein
VTDNTRSLNWLASGDFDYVAMYDIPAGTGLQSFVLLEVYVDNVLVTPTGFKVSNINGIYLMTIDVDGFSFSVPQLAEVFTALDKAPYKIDVIQNVLDTATSNVIFYGVNKRLKR